MAQREKVKRAQKRESPFGEDMDPRILVGYFFYRACERLGYAYHLLFQAPDSSRSEWAVARKFDPGGIELMKVRSSPDIVFDWKYFGTGRVIQIKNLLPQDLRYEFRDELDKIGYINRGLDQDEVTFNPYAVQYHAQRIAAEIKAQANWKNSKDVVRLPGTDYYYLRSVPKQIEQGTAKISVNLDPPETIGDSSLVATTAIPSAESRLAGKPKNSNPGGRPRDPNDDWAWEQVNEKKRAKLDVREEWLKRIGDRAKSLADSNDSFNKAVAKKRKNQFLPE